MREYPDGLVTMGANVDDDWVVLSEMADQSGLDKASQAGGKVVYWVMSCGFVTGYDGNEIVGGFVNDLGTRE